jgi:choline-sulfatase
MLPTLVDLAESTIQTAIDGRSLGPALNGGALAGPVYVEHIDGGTVAPRVMVRDEDMKLVYSRAYPAQLYDLAADPDELTNLSGRPDYAATEERLLGLVNETWDLEALADEVYANQTARKLIDTALGMGRRESWDFVPSLARESQRYVRHGDAFPDVERRGYLPHRQNS